MKYIVCSVAGTIGLSSLFIWRARAADMRLDTTTNNNSVLLPNLSFPSGNGHFDVLGGSTYKSLVESKGNTAAIYYNNFNSGGPFTAYPNPHDMAVAIQSYVNTYWSSGQNGWIALNEISSSNWQSNPTNSAGYDYHTWVIDVAALLKNGDSSDASHVVPAHTGVIMWAPFATPSSANRSSWQALTQYAYIADEDYINGATVQSDSYSVPKVQSFYQTSYNAWVNNAGVPANRLIVSEYYSNSLAGNGYGASGLSGETWQTAIECRNLAAHNVGFAGYMGYGWGSNAQGSSNATLISYENAYASTVVLQSEIPCWTGNNSSITGNSWADYLNWTGGLPSTTQFPYDPLLNNSYNVGVIQHQTAANFLSNANPSASGATITLDGSQSITHLTFAGANSYTIAPGTGGSLTLTGSGASIAVNSGSHYISAGLVLNNNVAASITGNLSFTGSVNNTGHTITKSGAGALIISGPQTNSAGSAISVTGGNVSLNSDAGSSTSQTMALSASTGGSITLNSAQHLSSFSLPGGNASIQTTGQYLFTHSLSITGGQLDVGQNDVIDDYTGTSPLAAIQAAIISGYNHGAWNGSGIVSTAIATHPKMAVGYAEASDVLGLTGSAKGTFDGQTVDSTTVLVKYTFDGDANLDGVVNALDFNALATHYGATGDGWWQGDFNNDGTVNSLDFDALAANFGDSMPSPADLPGDLPALSATAVPEPVMLSLLLLLPILHPRRRRRGSPASHAAGINRRISPGRHIV